MKCEVEGCDKPGPYVRAKCGMHYSRFRRGADLLKSAERRGLSDTEKVWQYVDVGSFDECWQWTGAFVKGYGRGADSSNRPVVASRFCFETFWQVQLEHLACHTCNNPPCCNPLHIYDGTTANNANDSVRAGTAYFLRPGVPKARGTAQHLAKLDEDKVRQIRTLYATGNVSQYDLASRFGVGQGRISDVLTRKTWAHVD